MTNLPSFNKYGVSILCFDNPSIANRDLSLIHSSLISSFIRGRTLRVFLPNVSMRILDPIASKTSIDSVLFNSQGLALNAYGLLVNAPTGHKSITLPDNSDLIVFSK